MRWPAHADVVVVGGGPAGAATAIALRSHGIGVTLVDRAVFPRDKVCGDVLLPSAQDALVALGLDTRPLEAIAYRCEGARYLAPGGRELSGEFRDLTGRTRPWWIVQRRRFDEWLINEARRAGVVVHEGVMTVGLRRDARGAVIGIRLRGAGAPDALPARVVVGADGASSVVAREVGASTRHAHLCLAARAYVPLSLPKPYLEVITTRETLPGCVWVLPVGPDVANVGAGLLQTTAQRLSLTPQAMFARVRQTSPLLASRLRDTGSIALRGWTLPGATERRPLAGDGWVLVGDAGAMVDPFTGHGIQNALAAARLAAAAIADAIRADDTSAAALAPYEQRWRSVNEDEITAGARLQAAHARPWLMRAAAAACGRHAGLRAIFLALVGHTESRETLLSPRALARASVPLRSSHAA